MYLFRLEQGMQRAKCDDIMECYGFTKYNAPKTNRILYIAPKTNGTRYTSERVHWYS